MYAVCFHWCTEKMFPLLLKLTSLAHHVLITDGATSEKPPSPTWPGEVGGVPPVVILADLAHCHQGSQVLVGLVRVDVVEGAAVPRVTVGGCEVDGYLQGPG